MLKPRPRLASIRARLTLSLLAALLVAAGAIGAVTYRNVLHEAETLFDYQLRQMALSLRDQGEIAPGEASAFNDADLDFVVQIWRIDGRSVYASRDHRALPARAVLGFADIESPGGPRWRTFAVAARDRVIQVAQPLAIRRGLAADAAWRGVLPLLAVAPLLAAALWWLIARALRPLRQLADQVRERDVAALAPLDEAAQPDEVAPLVHSLNALLARLGAALDSQRAFVADAAHELRSPLTALKLQAQMLQRAPDEATRSQALAALVAGVERATRLVAQLLALARSEPGAAAATPHAPVALKPLAQQVLADAAPLAAQRGSVLSLQADAVADDATVTGDAAALAMLLRNLVDNALRYTPPGGQVQVALEHAGGAEGGSAGVGSADVGSAGGGSAGGGDQGLALGASTPVAPAGWRLTVDDSGPGIPPSERERVFERFVRGAAASGEAGSGLGLAIVRAIVARHGGTVALDAAPLGGLRVVVDLPAAA